MTTGPSLTVALIVGGDAFKEGGTGPGDFQRCLESIKPHIDDLIVVDTGAGENARDIAKSFGARLFDFAWVDDFAAARNESWKHIETPWGVWIDHDDVLIGGENLKAAIAEAEPHPEVLGMWYPYQYAVDEYGNPTTIHRRERMVRMAAGWKWQNRVHEVLAPQSRGIWQKRDDTVWKHQRPPIPQMERNLRLLFMELAEKSDDPRTVNAIGHQYFSGGDWSKAADWYEKFAVDERGVVVERWQAMCYMSRCYRKTGDYDAALKWAWIAISLAPWWKDGYLQAAEAYTQRQEFDKAAYWAEYSRTQESPPEPAFYNPVEEGAQASCLLEICYSRLGRYEDALRENAEARKWMPKHEGLLHNKGVFQEALEKVQLRDSFITFSERLDDEQKLAMVGRLDGLSKEPGIRDVVIPAILRQAKLGSQPEITILCGETLDEWTAETPKTVGIGGSETAVVEIAARLARDGFRVWVYNKCGKDEGMHDGVGYIDWRRWRDDLKTDTFVAWRIPYEGHAKVPAKERWLWLHDLNKGSQVSQEACQPFDHIFGVSSFHADYLARVYPFLNARMGVLQNGIDLTRFDVPVERQPKKVIWTSSPDRGLLYLLEMWRDIVANVPDAELHIFYGWDNIDKLIAHGYGDLAAYKAMILERLKQPGVQWRGRVNQGELAKELLSSSIWAYPTSFVETYCLGAAEAMAAGCLPVTSRLGNIPNIVDDAGLLLPGHPGMPSYRRRFMGIIFSLLTKEATWEAYKGKGVERAQLFTWDKAVEAWKAQLKQPIAA